MYHLIIGEEVVVVVVMQVVLVVERRWWPVVMEVQRVLQAVQEEQIQGVVEEQLIVEIQE